MLKKFIVIILALVVAGASWLYLIRHNPVVYRHVDRAALQYGTFTILNPFRDRAPEIQAEKVLQKLTEGKCSEALALPEMENERIVYLCERENTSQIQSWSLVDRRDSENGVELVYRPERRYIRETLPINGEIHIGPAITINAKHLSDGWSALSYDTYY